MMLKQTLRLRLVLKRVLARRHDAPHAWAHVAQLPDFKAYIDKNAVLMARSLHGGSANQQNNLQQALKNI